jgi:hypothetical protein
MRFADASGAAAAARGHAASALSMVTRLMRAADIHAAPDDCVA